MCIYLYSYLSLTRCHPTAHPVLQLSSSCSSLPPPPAPPLHRKLRRNHRIAGQASQDTLPRSTRIEHQKVEPLPPPAPPPSLLLLPLQSFDLCLLLLPPLPAPAPSSLLLLPPPCAPPCLDLLPQVCLAFAPRPPLGMIRSALINFNSQRFNSRVSHPKSKYTEVCVQPW